MTLSLMSGLKQLGIVGGRTADDGKEDVAYQSVNPFTADPVKALRFATLV